MGSQQLYSLSWGEFGTSFASTVQVLRGQNEMVDVTLAAGGRIFTAHKLVLSAASPLLMELLKSTHCHHPVLMLAGITAPDLEALLQFVYQGEVSVDPSQLPSLLQAAHCLDIQALSPQTLNTDKTMTPLSVPVMMSESIADMSSIQLPTSRDVHSPLLPVRKRKRKQQNCADTEGVKWTVAGSGGVPGEGIVIEAQPLDHVVSINSQPVEQNMVDNSPKEEMLEDQQHCNGSKRLVSDMPVECTVCGVTLRQSRNLRRHMELIHLKVDNGKPRKSQLIKDENKAEDDTSIQTITDMESMETRIVEQPVRPSQLAVPSSQLTQQQTTQHTPVTSHQLTQQQTTQHIPSTSQHAPVTPHLLTSPPLYHSGNQCDPYSHTHTQTHAHTHLQFTHDNVFRQHQTELLRGAGLYADTREQHCATE